MGSASGAATKQAAGRGNRVAVTLRSTRVAVASGIVFEVDARVKIIENSSHMVTLEKTKTVLDALSRHFAR